jgi:hypothetical protein
VPAVSNITSTRPWSGRASTMTSKEISTRI